MPRKLAVAFSLLILCHSLLGDTPSWQGKMKSLADTIGALLPELVSKQSDAKVIENGAKVLSELSHDLKEGRKGEKLMPPSDNDPTVTFLSDQLSEQTRRAYLAIKQGQVEYGKNLLQGVTSYCIACHTRHDNGPEFSSFPLSAKANSLGKEERAALYVATRQFDKGFAEYQELILDQELLKKRPFEWERPLRRALAIAVRVKKDPVAASKALDAALASEFLPDFQRTKFYKWQKAIDAWKKEPKVKANTEAGLVAEMRRLFQEGSHTQLYPVDHSAEIQFLRTSAAAHELLRVARDPKVIAEALMTAGTAYAALADPAFWPMHEFFYEACVRQVPHSTLGYECYSKFESSVYLGYTGSSGTHIPGDIKKVLTELKALASPVKGSERKRNK